jgi:beta,beta-carotene 9',10'-dioxygenase
MTETVTAAPYQVGFATMRDEISIDDLPVTGDWPDWLSGTLIRNGPADFDGGRTPFRHWFDGQAMLHRFTIDGGRVSYANAFLDTPSLRSVRDRGRIGFTEFATDPCGSLFGRFFTRFHRVGTPNNAVNVVAMDGENLALGEVPMRVWFDKTTLDTLGVDSYDDDLDGTLTTAHPHRDPGTGDLVNFVLKFGRHSEYRVYRQQTARGPRKLIGRFATEHPGYVHSFAITERYAIVAVFPLVVNPLSFLLRGRPFIENYTWTPRLGTTFHVLDLADGHLVGSYRTDPFFAFHHINAFDEPDALVLDICAFPNADIVDSLYLVPLRACHRVPLSIPTRYRIDLAAGTVSSRPLAEVSVELPRIDHRRNGRDYSFVYGVGSQGERGDDFLNQLVKVDVRTGDSTAWHEPDCYPGEPVFVPASGAESEDRGVVLSVVLDAVAGDSFLLALDATSFREIARARVPHPVPFGFHGQFTGASGTSATIGGTSS